MFHPLSNSHNWRFSLGFLEPKNVMSSWWRLGILGYSILADLFSQPLLWELGGYFACKVYFHVTLKNLHKPVDTHEDDPNKMHRKVVANNMIPNQGVIKSLTLENEHRTKNSPTWKDYTKYFSANAHFQDVTWNDWIVAPNGGHQQGLKSHLSKENPGCLGYRGDYTTQLCRDHNKPM